MLSRRANALVGKAGDASTGAAEDLAAEAVEEFLERVDGWLAEPARVAPEAQAVHLLNLCFLHAKTRWIDERGWAARQEPVESEGEGDDPPRRTAVFEPSFVEALEARQDSQKSLLKLGEVLGELAPVRLLAFICIERPQHLERAMVDACGRQLSRGCDETWKLLTEARTDEALLADPPEWKRRIACILRSDKPLGLLTPQDLKKAVNYLDQNVRRAREDLARRLAGSR